MSKQLRYNASFFLMPFIVLTFLTLPSLLVLAVSKSSAGFAVLVQLGYFQLIQAVLWLVVPLMGLCAALYMVKSRSVAGRLLVGVLLAVVLVSFWYVIFT